MFFSICRVTINQDGTKTAVAKESYRNSATFLNRYEELLNDIMYQGVWDEEACERRNYNFGWEIMNDSQSGKLGDSIFLAQHDYICLTKKYGQQDLFSEN